MAKRMGQELRLNLLLGLIKANLKYNQSSVHAKNISDLLTNISAFGAHTTLYR